MKSKYFIVLSFLFFQNLLAQIPNSGFENWSNGEPVSWITNNIPGYLTPVTISTTAHSGNYSAKIEMMNSMLGLLQPVLSAGSSGTGVPVTQRHNTINFWYRYFPNSSTVYLVISVAMMKGGQFIGVAVGRTKTAAANFTKMTTNINYSSGQVPDAATIYITLIDSFSNTSSVGSYALVDDIYFDQPSDVEPEGKMISEFSLEQNFPNPFNPVTTINWQSPISGQQTLKVFDILGNQVATILDEFKPAGKYEVEFNATKLPSGVYFYELHVSALADKNEKSENYTEAKKMILLK